MLIKIGTRSSPLAMAQTHHIMGLIKAVLPEAEFTLHAIATMADRDRVSEFHQFGVVGVFAVEHESQLLSREVDCVVHSLKDLPTSLAEGLTLAAVPSREDPRDALCGATLHELPQGARVGTGSLRRRAQIQSLRPDVEVVPIRGNVGPRLRKIEGEGGLDAVILAAAGLRRLGLSGSASETMDPAVFPYAVGQGALGVEARAGDENLLAVLKRIEDPTARAAVEAERAMMHALGAGCSLPVGAGRLTLRSQVTSLDGRDKVVAVEEGPAERAREVGLASAERLRERGGAKILEASYRDFSHFKTMRS